MKPPTWSGRRPGIEFTPESLDEALDAVQKEFLRAGNRVSPFASAHEAVAKIREEYLELEREVFEKKRDEEDWQARREEAMQIAAVAIKFMVEFRDRAEE